MRCNVERILMTTIGALVLSIAAVSFGIAYAGGIRGAALVGLSFFVTIGIIIVLDQVIPAGILLSSFIGTGFSYRR
jgi:hypothetical protein